MLFCVTRLYYKHVTKKLRFLTSYNYFDAAEKYANQHLSK